MVQPKLKTRSAAPREWVVVDPRRNVGISPVYVLIEGVRVPAYVEEGNLKVRMPNISNKGVEFATVAVEGQGEADRKLKVL